MKLGTRIAALVVVLVAVVAGLAGLTASSTAQTCTYPFDNCSTTTSAPPSTTPGNTTTTQLPGCGHGDADEHNPHCTTTTEAGQSPPVTSLVDPCILTPNGPVDLIFSVDPTSGTPGTQVTVNVQGVPPGTTVDITFNGTVVATTTVPGQLGTPGCPAAAGSFAVPAVAPGAYLVCAIAAGAPAKCTTFIVPTTVLGISFSRGGAPLVSAGNPNSVIAFTGFGLVRLLALAAALIAAGWFLVRRDRRRGRRRGHASA